MEDIVGGIFYFLLRAISWFIIELLFNIVCWGIELGNIKTHHVW